MRSPTQLDLAPGDIAAIVGDGLGATMSGATELSGGGFAAVWRASLTDGREVVVKVAPPPSARLLSYEKELIPAEAEYFAMVAGLAPVPSVLAVSPRWIITSLLPGRPLHARLMELTRLHVGAEQGFALNPSLAPAEVPALRLDAEGARLGWTSWLGGGEGRAGRGTEPVFGPDAARAA